MKQVVCIPVVFLIASLAMRAQGTTDYRLDVVGPRNVNAGYDLYVALKPIFTAGKPSHLYFNSVQVPPAVTYDLICRASGECWVDPKQHRQFQWGGTGTTILHLHTRSDSPLGSYSAVVTTEAGGVVHNTTVPFHVLAVPPLPAKRPVTSVPKIPGLKTWAGTMRSLGKRWCNLDKQYGFGYEGDVWYYDGGRVYFQIADYTGNKDWEKCGLHILNQYRDSVLSRDGKYQGWRVFTKGLVMAYQRFGDEKAKQAVLLLAKNSAFATAGGAVSDDAIRETAYIAEAYMSAEKLGEPRNPLLARAIDYLLGHYEMIFQDHVYSVHQSFYDGLAAEALIEYFELTKDPRIPPAIKLMLDWSGRTGQDPKTHGLVYDADAKPPKYSTELNNLVAPAFAWYWHLTGDPVYQQWGDAIFSHAFDIDTSYSGKIFSQNYRWSFDYVNWRSTY